MAGKTMKMIQEELTAKEEQLRILQAEINLLRSLLARANGDPDPTVARKRAPRSNVKNLILALLQETGTAGLNAAIAVEMAEKRGQKLERGSASSLLSRLKSDGTITYDNDRYRLKGIEPENPNSTGWTSNVHPHPASKGLLG
ncbi:hypothetical protein [Mesorhizobium helmanticense]|uniref:Uncharacterized protein n=1 Tax=Mesorhizobium helmanticense TaxID=1776423 RepID=A0A2T4IP62_9HYPH|nr:hypothetical protein [Mesorhizobium helmanticense]PTE07441.1 hypothetical protein C9427_25225 [Mesorhizobium helmanticense]